MNWFNAAWIFGGVAVFIWIIIAAKIECDRMNAGSK